MKERKYKEDWVNETRFDDQSGKETRTPVYRGPWFQGLSGRERKRLLSLAFFPWLAYAALLVLYFRLNFPGATVLYVFLPAALGLFPALYWLLGIRSLMKAPEKQTRLQKENSIGRILRSAAGCMISACAALIGDLVLLLGGGDAAREWPGMLMLLGAAVLSFGVMNSFRDINRRLSEEGGGRA